MRGHFENLLAIRHCRRVFARCVSWIVQKENFCRGEAIVPGKQNDHPAASRKLIGKTPGEMHLWRDQNRGCHTARNITTIPNITLYT